MLETATMMRELKNSGWQVVDIITRPNHNDMAEGLVRNWNQGDDIIICGQDNVCEINQLTEMLACKEQVCAIPCIQGTASTALPGQYLNQISHGMLHPADSTFPYVRGNWAEDDVWYLGTGICCIKSEAQARSAKWITPETCYYQAFDTGITRALDRAGYKKGHLHYPIHKHCKLELDKQQ